MSTFMYIILKLAAAAVLLIQASSVLFDTPGFGERSSADILVVAIAFAMLGDVFKGTSG